MPTPARDIICKNNNNDNDNIKKVNLISSDPSETTLQSWREFKGIVNSAISRVTTETNVTTRCTKGTFCQPNTGMKLTSS
ncbi:hypothetical protein ZHAS_00014401 [Anopheles sinensis]|uniref:Uncharacterized protein n=1 Tax=Anopheles sinensis TaxID=74873 RepID=A0A084W860_ANOSI|nr:hypothetical protein ZHAS_00014401 [Anopheles sinensis]